MKASKLGNGGNFLLNSPKGLFLHPQRMRVDLGGGEVGLSGLSNLNNYFSRSSNSPRQMHSISADITSPPPVLKRAEVTNEKDLHDYRSSGDFLELFSALYWGEDKYFSKFSLNERIHEPAEHGPTNYNINQQTTSLSPKTATKSPFTADVESRDALAKELETVLYSVFGNANVLKSAFERKKYFTTFTREYKLIYEENLATSPTFPTHHSLENPEENNLNPPKEGKLPDNVDPISLQKIHKSCSAHEHLSVEDHIWFSTAEKYEFDGNSLNVKETNQNLLVSSETTSYPENLNSMLTTLTKFRSDKYIGAVKALDEVKRRNAKSREEDEKYEKIKNGVFPVFSESRKNGLSATSDNKEASTESSTESKTDKGFTDILSSNENFPLSKMLDKEKNDKGTEKQKFKPRKDYKKMFADIGAKFRGRNPARDGNSAESSRIADSNAIPKTIEVFQKALEKASDEDQLHSENQNMLTNIAPLFTPEHWKKGNIVVGNFPNSNEKTADFIFSGRKGLPEFPRNLAQIYRMENGNFEKMRSRAWNAVSAAVKELERFLKDLEGDFATSSELGGHKVADIFSSRSKLSQPFFPGMDAPGLEEIFIESCVSKEFGKLGLKRGCDLDFEKEEREIEKQARIAAMKKRNKNRRYVAKGSTKKKRMTAERRKRKQRNDAEDAVSISTTNDNSTATDEKTCDISTNSVNSTSDIAGSCNNDNRAEKGTNTTSIVNNANDADPEQLRTETESLEKNMSNSTAAGNISMPNSQSDTIIKPKQPNLQSFLETHFPPVIASLELFGKNPSLEDDEENMDENARKNQLLFRFKMKMRKIVKHNNSQFKKNEKFKFQILSKEQRKKCEKSKNCEEVENWLLRKIDEKERTGLFIPSHMANFFGLIELDMENSRSARGKQFLAELEREKAEDEEDRKILEEKISGKSENDGQNSNGNSQNSKNPNRSPEKHKTLNNILEMLNSPAHRDSISHRFSKFRKKHSNNIEKSTNEIFGNSVNVEKLKAEEKQLLAEIRNTAGSSTTATSGANIVDENSNNIKSHNTQIYSDSRLERVSKTLDSLRNKETGKKEISNEGKNTEENSNDLEPMIPAHMRNHENKHSDSESSRSKIVDKTQNHQTYEEKRLAALTEEKKKDKALKRMLRKIDRVKFESALTLNLIANYHRHIRLIRLAFRRWRWLNRRGEMFYSGLIDSSSKRGRNADIEKRSSSLTVFDQHRNEFGEFLSKEVKNDKYGAFGEYFSDEFSIVEIFAENTVVYLIVT